jgi:hypothetical protein
MRRDVQCPEKVTITSAVELGSFGQIFWEYNEDYYYN